MKVLICGGAATVDARVVCQALDHLHARTEGGIRELILAGDRRGNGFSHIWGLLNDVPCRRVFPRRKKLRLSQSRRRHARVLVLEKPDVVVALPGDGPARKHLVQEAVLLGTKVCEISPPDADSTKP